MANKNMAKPKFFQKVLDHFWAWYWAGRPVFIIYPDRNKYFLINFKSHKIWGDAWKMIDGSYIPGFVPIVRIFRPAIADPAETLRHECSHIRFDYLPSPVPEVAEEAVRLFEACEPEVAEVYAERSDESGMTSEAVVRLADRMRSRQDMPPMSEALTRLVKRVAHPAPGLALAHVGVVALLISALLSASVSAEESPARSIPQTISAGAV